MDSPKIAEKSLHEVWIKQSFEKPLETIHGDEIEVLDIGIANTETGGPDFKNGRIRIGNLTYVGDIEIDTSYNDWKSHGHNINSKYNKVVLHLCLFNKFNQAYVYTKDGRKVPTISLYHILGNEYSSLLKEKQNYSKSNKSDFLRCIDVAGNVEIEEKKKFISELGLKRFEKKCERIFHRLKELSFLKSNQIHEPVIRYELTPQFEKKEFCYEDFKGRDIWIQLLYEYIFEALGYSKNKTIMLKLAQSADVNLFSKIPSDNNFTLAAESVLFNIGGLIPDVKKLPDIETSEYTKQLASYWDSIKSEYDGKIYDEADWHFFRLRPQNFPTIRISGGVRILNQLLHENLIGTMIKKISEIRNPQVLLNSLRSLLIIKGDGFWHKHYIFDQPTNGTIKYFIGVSRADEIVVNVILPFFSVYFNIFDKDHLAKKILNLYTIYEQKADNKIIRSVAESLNVDEFLHRTVYSQGMIELFRNYCSKNKCMECSIGKRAFE